MVKWQAECLRSWGIYEKVKDTPQMQALLTKYEPFMADKATFS